MMPIREELRKISSIQTKLSLLFFVDGDYKGDMRRKVLKLLLTATNSFSISDKFADTSFEVEFEEFIMGG
jgi:5S rRNA maturation endonuclease (ribonuclease M5)